MANIVIPFAAVSHAPVPSVGFNNNFTEVAQKFNTYAVQTDVAKVIAAAHTWNAAQTWTVAQSFPGITLTGHLLFTDNTYDIGQVGATRPRNGYFAGNVVVGGLMTVAAGASLGFGGSVLGESTGAGVLVAGSVAGDVVLRSAAAKNLLFSIDGGGTIAGKFAATTGIFTVNNGLVIGAGGASIVGDVLFTDALYDIGKTGATRPRDGFFSRNLTVGGSLTVAGVTSSGPVTATLTSTSGALNLVPAAADPSISTNNGDVWILTSGAMKAKLNGAIRTLWHSGQVSSGYTAWTGTVNRTTAFDQSTVTLPQLAQRVAAMQTDFMANSIMSV